MTEFPEHLRGVGKVKDLASRYGQWEVLERLPPKVFPSGNRKQVARCRCTCGLLKEVLTDTLFRGLSTSCGCERSKTHGESNTRLYHCWESMKARVRSRIDCELYAPWKSYEVFRDWAVNNGYTKSLILCRNRDSGNYQPDNVRWDTKANNNREMVEYVRMGGTDR